MAAHFKAYHSIDNQNNSKMLTKIYELDHEKNTGLWVALEKVHGCNFSFLVGLTNSLTNSPAEGDDLYVRVAKRTSILEEGENLNNIPSRKIIAKYGPSAKEAFKMVKKTNNKLKQLTIFGELFGGHYPHPNVEIVKDAKLAQKGIYYHNDNDFYAFDIHDGEKYLDYDVCMKIFQQCKFFYAEPLFTGTLKEVLKFPNTFETTLPKHYGHPSLTQKNISEGLILKPIKTLRMHNGKRMILKNKTEEHLEVKKSKKEKMTIHLDDVEKVWNILKLYVTKNRLENVESHGLHGKHCIGPLANDAMKEFLRDESSEILEIYQRLTKEQKKIIKTRLGVACKNVIDNS